MVKFDGTGQAYWDFILENCPKEFVQAIEKDLFDSVLECEILDVKSRAYNTGGAFEFEVYLNSEMGPIVHSCILFDNGFCSSNRYVLPYHYIEDFKKLGVI